MSSLRSQLIDPLTLALSRGERESFFDRGDTARFES